VSVVDLLVADISRAMAYAEDRSGFVGTGTGSEFGGIVGLLTKVNDGSHGKAIVDAAAGHATFATLDVDDLVATMAAVPVYARMGSAWICSPTCAALTFEAIKASGGGNTFMDLEAGGQPKFLGYPVHLSDTFPDDASGTYDALPILAFGNLSLAATLGSRRDVRIATSTDAGDAFAKDQVLVKGTLRHDISIHDVGSDAIKSPIVCLRGNSS
jgi:HK97 family phage major capsid protein